jgi:GNAT superfamily N-acetyltransferase
MRSKAYWGYDEAFMRACVPALTITPERIRGEIFFVLVEGDEILGFVGLCASGADEAELTNLFVEPTTIRRGFGRRLFECAVGVARAQGWRSLSIASDPFAAPFYETMGATPVGETPSDAIPGRMLPLLTYNLAPARRGIVPRIC